MIDWSRLDRLEQASDLPSGYVDTMAGGGRMPEGGGGTDRAKSSQNLNFFLYSGRSHVEHGIPEQPLSSLLHRNCH